MVKISEIPEENPETFKTMEDEIRNLRAYTTLLLHNLDGWRNLAGNLSQQKAERDRAIVLLQFEMDKLKQNLNGWINLAQQFQRRVYELETKEMRSQGTKEDVSRGRYAEAEAGLKTGLFEWECKESSSHYQDVKDGTDVLEEKGIVSKEELKEKKREMEEEYEVKVRDLECELEEREEEIVRLRREMEELKWEKTQIEVETKRLVDEDKEKLKEMEYVLEESVGDIERMKRDMEEMKSEKCDVEEEMKEMIEECKKKESVIGCLVDEAKCSKKRVEEVEEENKKLKGKTRFWAVLSSAALFFAGAALVFALRR